MPLSLKIGFAARGLSSGHSGPTEFIDGFIRALLKHRKDHQLVVYYNASGLLGRYPEAEERSLPGANRLVWDHLLLPAALRRDEIDLVILPKGTMPLWGAGRAIVVMHDLGYFHPELDAYRPLETIYMQSALRRASQRAWGVFTVSEFTRQDVISTLKASPEYVHTIYEACRAEYAPVRDEAQLARVRARYGLLEPFIFYPTSISPRKNIERLLEALEAVQGRIPHHLYLTGGRSWNAGVIERRLSQAVPDRVHRLGAVDPGDMPVLYSLASFAVCVSLYEGFGLPVLEAFQSGTPVMISDQTSLPEIAGGAALVVDGYSTDEIARGLVQMATDRDLRESLRERGFQRARDFSWDDTAQKALGWIEKRWRGQP